MIHALTPRKYRKIVHRDTLTLLGHSAFLDYRHVFSGHGPAQTEIGISRRGNFTTQDALLVQSIVRPAS